MLTEELSKYQQFLRIDKYNLDTCIEEQVAYFDQVAQNSAMALADRDGAKKRMEEAYAKISLNIRAQLERQGKKLTEDALRQSVLKDREYRAYVAEYLDSEAISSRWSALKEAFVQRGFMLKEMANLYVAGYFTDISMKTNNIEETQVQVARSRVKDKRRPLPVRKNKLPDN